MSTERRLRELERDGVHGDELLHELARSGWTPSPGRELVGPPLRGIPYVSALFWIWRLPGWWRIHKPGDPSGFVTIRLAKGTPQ